MEEIPLTERHKLLLFQIPLFNELPLNTKNSLLEKLDFSVYKIHKNDVVAKQNTLCRQLMILLEGKLRVDMMDGSDNEILIEYIVPPRTFATPYLFKEDVMLPATFTSEGYGVVLMVNKESFFKQFSLVPHLLKNFLCIVGKCTKCSEMRLKALSYKNIRSRFIVYLFDQQNEGDDVVHMEHNQVQLADYLCVTRPALTKEINKLVKESLIIIKGRKVQILDALKLRREVL